MTGRPLASIKRDGNPALRGVSYHHRTHPSTPHHHDGGRGGGWETESPALSLHQTHTPIPNPNPPTPNPPYSSYLFPEIARRRTAFLEANPDAKIISLGIGDTTQPIPPHILSGLVNGAQKLGALSLLRFEAWGRGKAVSCLRYGGDVGLGVFGAHPCSSTDITHKSIKIKPRNRDEGRVQRVRRGAGRGRAP